MTPHLQLNAHDPDAGVYGDCFRTCLGCLLDLPPSEVPDFHGGTGDAQRDLARGWLAPQGLTLIDVPFDGTISLPVLLASAGLRSGPDCHFIVMGRSPRGIDHVVIADPQGVVHDPRGCVPEAALAGPATDGFWWISWLGKLV